MKGENLNAFERRLEQRRMPGAHQRFMLRRRFQYAVADLERERTAGIDSTLNALAVRLGTFASVLSFMTRSHSKENLESSVGFFGATPNAIIRMMKEQIGNIQRKHQLLVASNINPQAKITVRPYFERARRALELWKQKQVALW